jgi:hypothetical protein
LFYKIKEEKSERSRWEDQEVPTIIAVTEFLKHFLLDTVATLILSYWYLSKYNVIYHTIELKRYKNRFYCQTEPIFRDSWFRLERLCFSPGMNLSGGKDIRLLTYLITSRNAFLIDDNPRYLMTNPPGLRKFNGGTQGDLKQHQVRFTVTKTIKLNELEIASFFARGMTKMCINTFQRF